MIERIGNSLIRYSERVKLATQNVRSFERALTDETGENVNASDYQERVNGARSRLSSSKWKQFQTLIGIKLNLEESGPSAPIYEIRDFSTQLPVYSLPVDSPPAYSSPTSQEGITPRNEE